MNPAAIHAGPERVVADPAAGLSGPRRQPTISLRAGSHHATISSGGKRPTSEASGRLRLRLQGRPESFERLSTTSIPPLGPPSPASSLDDAPARDRRSLRSGAGHPHRVSYHNQRSTRPSATPFDLPVEVLAESRGRRRCPVRSAHHAPSLNELNGARLDQIPAKAWLHRERRRGSRTTPIWHPLLEGEVRRLP